MQEGSVYVRLKNCS